MKKLLQTIILTAVSYSLVGCAFHTTRSYTYGCSERVYTQPSVVVTSAPYYRSVRGVPDYPPYRKSTPHFYVVE